MNIDISTNSPVQITLDELKISHQTADIEIFNFIENELAQIRDELQTHFIKLRDLAIHDKNKNRRRFSTFTINHVVSKADNNFVADDPFEDKSSDSLTSLPVNNGVVKKFSSFEKKSVISIDDKIKSINLLPYQKIYQFLSSKGLLVQTFSNEFLRIKGNSATWYYDDETNSYTGPSNETIGKHSELLNKFEETLSLSKNSLVEELYLSIVFNH